MNIQYTLRGSSWIDFGGNARSARDPGDRFDYYGFRTVSATVLMILRVGGQLCLTRH